MPQFKTFLDASRDTQTHSLFREAFSEKSAENAVNKIKSVLERQLGVVLYQHPSVDVYVNSIGKQYGIRFYIGNTTQAIRFNFDKKSGSVAITSVDVWDPSEGRNPAARIDTRNVNIVNIISNLIQVIKSPNSFVGKAISETPVSEAVDVAGQTYESKSKAIESLLRQGHAPKEIAALTGANVSQIYGIKSKIGRPSAEPQSEAPVSAGLPEQSADPDVADGIAQLSRTKYADPKTVFEDLRDLLDLVISGVQPSVLITGMAGIGKTHDVTSRISEFKDEDEIKMIKGFSTPYGLYQTLYNNRHKLLVFDDCDSIFKDANARNILKAALDSYDVRKVSWISKSTFDAAGLTEEEIDAKNEETDKLPSEFEFDGQVVFISNLHLSQIESAIRSRTMAIDITLRAQDVFVRIESILDKLAPGIDFKLKKEALKHLKVNHDKLGKPANLRTMLNAAKIRAGGSPNWKRLVERYS